MGIDQLVRLSSSKDTSCARKENQILAQNNEMAERTGIFDDVDYLVSDISKAYRSRTIPDADVTFTLSDGGTIETNRFMLVLRSKYFATKLLELEEDYSKKVVINCNSKIFQLLLNYIWEGKVDFSDLELQHLLDLLEAARMTCMERLVAGIQVYLSYLLEAGQIELNDYWIVLDFCSKNGFKEILTSALKYIYENFSTICSFKSSFSKLPKEIIFILLENKNRTAQEIDVFKGVTLWLENQTSLVEDSTRAAMLDLVDLAAITPADMLRVVRRSGLYTDMDICDALEKGMNKKHVEISLPGTLERQGDEKEDKKEINEQKEHFTGEDNKSLTQEYEVEETVGAASYEDHEKALRDDAQDDDLDVKSSESPRHSLIKWWKSRDSLLSPSKGM